MSGPRTALSPDQFSTALNKSTQDLAQLSEHFRIVERCFIARAPQFPQLLVDILEELLDEAKKDKNYFPTRMDEIIHKTTFPTDMTWAWDIGYAVSSAGCKEKKPEYIEFYSTDVYAKFLPVFARHLQEFDNKNFLIKYLARQAHFYRHYNKESKSSANENLHDEVMNLKELSDKYNDVMPGKKEQVLAKINKAFTESKELNQEFADRLVLDIFVGRDIFEFDFTKTKKTALNQNIVGYLACLQEQAVRYIQRIEPKPTPAEPLELKAVPSTTPVATADIHALPVCTEEDVVNLPAVVVVRKPKQAEKKTTAPQEPDLSLETLDYLFSRFDNDAHKKEIIARANKSPALAKETYKTFKRKMGERNSQIENCSLQSHKIAALEAQLSLCNLMKEIDVLKNQKKKFTSPFWQRKQPLGLLLEQRISSINDQLSELKGARKLKV